MIKIVPMKKSMLAELAECFRAAYAPLGEDWTPEKALAFFEYKFRRQPDLCFAALDKSTGGGV